VAGVAAPRSSPSGTNQHSPAPFVVGFGRSGNTLLRLLLDAHPELAIPPETDFVPVVAYAQSAEEFLQGVLGHWRIRDLQVDADSIAREVRALRPFDVGAALRVVYRQYAAKFGKSRWGDKTPGYVRYMTLIASVLPEAHFIHMIRDGRDAWVSIRDLWFGPNTVDGAARTWVEWIADARRDAQVVPYYTEVLYERLVSEPEAVLRELCAYLDLRWDDALLRSHERAPERVAEVITEYREGGHLVATVEQRHALHAWTSRPPDVSHVGRWRRELPAEEVDAFEAIAGGMLRSLGYD
jgi:Sulfotransferase family